MEHYTNRLSKDVLSIYFKCISYWEFASETEAANLPAVSQQLKHYIETVLSCRKNNLGVTLNLVIAQLIVIGHSN